MSYMELGGVEINVKPEKQSETKETSLMIN